MFTHQSESIRGL